MVPQPVSDRRVAMGRLAIIVTVTAWAGYVVTWFFEGFFRPHHETAAARAEAVLYLLIVTMLTVSALAYLLSRLGFFYRTRTHHRARRAILDQFFDATTPTLTTIIPSYQEDARVIRNTLLSAALQEYPGKRVVLLIDDPFVPKTRLAREQLEAARALPDEIRRLLADPAARFSRALDAFERSAERGEPLSIGSMTALASHYDEAVGWLENLAASQEVIDHTDAFFANEVVLRLAGSVGEIKQALLSSADEGVVLERPMFRRLYRRLVWTFRVEVSSFERKRYVSLSHEPNKAMNLNSYLGLMGGSYRQVRTVTGTALIRSTAASGDLSIPDPDYVVTLDADSVLLPEYCLRLVHLLEQSEYRDMAIAQTPYSAFPGSVTRLERIAGATTDLKHIVHQGLTYYDATFWVGANAVIRKRALDDIAETSYIGDWEIRHYIRDRTVIEDTESTIDMGIHGWRLFNCPERLSYSATPPDFGSLCIQRRRWANGGLLILPRLRRQSHARRAAGQRTRFGELFLRCNYMASICWSSVNLLVLLAFPFSATLISPLLGLVALPYFLAMASDLRYCGYKRLDVLRIYGFNLMLLPVNLAGTLSSIVQGITASKAPFARTPKVRNRTVVPPVFVIAPYLVIALAGDTFYFACRQGRVDNMAYAAFNVVLGCYAVKAFIGLRNSVVDAWIHATSLLYKPPRKRRRLPGKRAEQQVPPPVDWRSVFEVGYTEPQDKLTQRQLAVKAPPEPAEPPEALEEPPRRRLSVLRIAVALVLIAGAGYGGLIGARTLLAARAVIHQTWFAPYVDVTLTPTQEFQDSSADGARQTALGLHAGPGRPVARPRLAHRPGAAGRGAAHRVVRRPGPHQPRRRVHQRAGPHRGLPVGDRRLSAQDDRPRHRERGPGQLLGRPAPRGGCGRPGAGGAHGASPAQRLADPAGRALGTAGRRDLRDLLDAARPRLRHRHQRHDHGLHPASRRRDHDAATGGERAARDPGATRRPVPPLRHPPARPADLAAARGHGDDRPERHPGRELHRARRPGPGELRSRERSRPDLHVVAQPGRPVRLVVSRERAAVQHVQRHRPVQPRVLPRLRAVARRRLDRVPGRGRPARRGRHEPGGRALSRVVRRRRLPVRVQGRAERRDLPGEVVQHRR
jgi:cellulose synthase/poly-beta-1,6-N-acetylglucosamine synthase-like glycosyltransferase